MCQCVMSLPRVELILGAAERGPCSPNSKHHITFFAEEFTVLFHTYCQWQGSTAA